ncbi:unnamed protein product [Diamesa hyperborea]
MAKMSKLSPYSTTKKITVQDLRDIKAKGGKITKNPFFNFVRTVRLLHPGRRQAEVAIIAGELWKQLDCDTKLEFYGQALLQKRYDELNVKKGAMNCDMTQFTKPAAQKSELISKNKKKRQNRIVLKPRQKRR